MQKILFFILCFACATTLLGQTPSSAEKLFKAGKYADAQKAYKALLKSYPSNQLYLYRYARCAQELGDDATAIKYFNKSGNRYVLKHFYSAESHLRLWEVEEAITAYETYQQKEPNEHVARVQKQLAKAQQLQRYLKRVEILQVIDSVHVPLNKMLQVINLSAEAGQLTWDANKSIVYTNQRNDRRLWGTKHQQNTLLVSSQRLLDSWSTPDTLPVSINYSEHQTSPFLLNDGVTLYFAAQNEEGLGGLDIYVSRYNTITESYTSPENMGLPYNSPDNEYIFAVDEVRQIGYLATDRFAKKGYVHVYSFAITWDKQYWRNLNHKTLVEYARLNKFERYSGDNIATVQEENIPDEIADFQFVLNDSIVYTSLADFQSQAARDMYNEWKQTEQQYLSEQLQLHLLREEYANAEESRKKELTPTILRLENNQSQLHQRCQAYLQEIRKLEQQSAQQ